MYLKTPKRYTSGRRRRSSFSFRWLWLWIVTPLAVVGAIAVYENQDEFVPPVSTAVAEIIGDAGNTVATARAPEPTPTQNPASNIQRANDAWMRGSVGEAVDLYDEVMLAVPNELPIHYRYTLGLLMQDFNMDAIEAAENAVTANPFDPNAWAIRAMAYSRNGSTGEAIASALHALYIASEDAVAQNPDIMAPARARAQAFLAEAYFYEEQYQRALDTVEAALDTYPDSGEAYYVRGLIKWLSPTLIDRVGALADFQTAYELAPSYHYIAADMMFLNAELAAATGEDQYVQDAISIAEQVLELNPNFPRALQWLANYNLRTVGDFNQAADYASRCTRANPNLARCYYIYGRAQMQLEQYIDAGDSFQQAIETAETDDGLIGYYYWWAAEAPILLDNDCGEAMNYLREGWEIAQVSQDTGLIDSYAVSFRRCGSTIGQPTPTPIPEITPEAQGADA